MVNYYTDSAKKSLWVLTVSCNTNNYDYDETLTCFVAKNHSGFHVGQRVNNPKLDNWLPLEGEISVSDILYV